MSECPVSVKRVPQKDGRTLDDHAYMQACGRPVEDDGLCRFHARQRLIDRDDERRQWRSQLRKVARA